MAFFYWISKN